MASERRLYPEDLQLLETERTTYIRCSGRTYQLTGLHSPALGARPDEQDWLESLIEGQRPRPSGQLAADNSPHSIVEIALRNRHLVLVLGEDGDGLRENVCAALGASFRVLHMTSCMSNENRQKYLSRYEAAHGFPIEPGWTKSEEIDRKILRDPDLRMVIVTTRNLPYESLFDLLQELKEVGIPLLPVTYSSIGIEIGPLILAPCLGSLMKTRFESLEFDDVVGHPLGLFSTGSPPSMSQDALTKASELIVQKAIKPHQNDWLQWSIVGPEGSTRKRAVFRGDSLVSKRFPGSLWGIQNFLDDAILNLPELWPRISSAIKKGSLVSLESAFHRDFAESVYHTLDTSRGWKVHEAFFDDFFFHHHNIYDERDFNATLLLTGLVFNSSATIEWIKDLTGLDCSEPAVATPSWYMCGDHSTPHSDCVDKRLIAFVWHLTKQWSREWGGHLVWCPTGDLLPPTFNTLNLFNIRKGQTHFVMTVAPHARGKRLCWNGWWCGSFTEAERTSRVETLGTDRARAFPVSLLEDPLR
jgi:2OG-Fe(II) oxygenase superfamily